MGLAADGRETVKEWFVLRLYIPASKSHNDGHEQGG
jgi:hypothetical protein